MSHGACAGVHRLGAGAPRSAGRICWSPVRGLEWLPVSRARHPAVAGFVLALLAVALVAFASNVFASAAPRTIPFTVRNNKIVLPVTVADSRRLRIILDSGMANGGLLITNSALIDSIALPGANRANIGGAGSGPPQTALFADSLAFRAGDAVFTGQRIIILEGDAMRGFPTDGVCGYTLLGSHAVEIDYDRMEITLRPSRTAGPGPEWRGLPLAFKENRIPWITIVACTRGTDAETLSCYIDLASSETVEFLTRDGMKFAPPDGLEEVYLGRGLSGDIHGQRGRIPWVEIGGKRFQDLEVAFAPAAVRSKQPGADAVIGNGLLRRFHCIFDYDAGRLYLKPNGFRPPR